MDHQTLVYHAIFAAAVLWPAIVICRRAGLNRIWALTICIPVFGLVIYACALAMLRWPEPVQGDAV